MKYDLLKQKEKSRISRISQMERNKISKVHFLSKLEPTKSGYFKPEKVNIVIIDKVKR